MVVTLEASNIFPSFGRDESGQSTDRTPPPRALFHDFPSSFHVSEFRARWVYGISHRTEMHVNSVSIFELQGAVCSCWLRNFRAGLIFIVCRERFSYWKNSGFEFSLLIFSVFQFARTGDKLFKFSRTEVCQFFFRIIRQSYDSKKLFQFTRLILR